MTPQRSLLAIVLPLAQPPDSSSLLKKGDCIEAALQPHLFQLTTTYPMSLLKNKKLILKLSALPHGTSLVVFYSLDVLHSLFSGEVHLLAITQQKLKSLQCFSGDSAGIRPVPLPLVDAAALVPPFPAGLHSPHIVAIDSAGKVQALLKGYYSTANHLRR